MCWQGWGNGWPPHFRGRQKWYVLWLLVSEPAVVGRFMGMSAVAIEERGRDALRRVAVELLGTGRAALKGRRSRKELMAFVDAAARQRAGCPRRRALLKEMMNVSEVRVASVSNHAW